MQKLLVFGSGVLASQTLDLLALKNLPFDEIVVASRSLEKSQMRANLSKFVGIDLGNNPNIRVISVDLRDVESTARMIAEERPDLIFQAASLWNWWRIRELPTAYFQRLDALGLGPWAPLHMALTLNVARATKAAGSRAVIVNGCYPDVTNPVLTRAGLPILCGIGNVGRSIAILRLAFAEHLGLGVPDVEVRLFAEHYVGYHLIDPAGSAKLPQILRVLVRGEDVTDRLPVNQVLRSIAQNYPRVRGMAGQLLTASSAYSVLHTIACEQSAIQHVPGPLGLVGGYPCRFVDGVLEGVELGTVALEDGIRVNEEGLALEGIEAIAADGTITFCEQSMEVLHEMFGYKCHTMRVDDVWGHAEEMLAKYEAFAARFEKRPVL